MGKTFRLSATQIDKFKRCPRAWAWEYISGHRQAPHIAFALGTEVHRILEEYLEFGKPPQRNVPWSFDESPGKVYYPGDIALTMINKELPKPKERYLSIEEMFVEEIGGVTYTGKIDVSHSVDLLTLGIIDHKTSSNPQKWGKTYEGLALDVQRILYTKVALDHLNSICAPECRFALNYGSTDAKQNKAFFLAYKRVNKDEITEDFFREIDPVAHIMVHAREESTNPLDLPYNASACEAFGGCQHKHRCNLTKQERIGAIIMKDQSVQELLAKAKKKREEAGDIKVAPSVNPPESEEKASNVRPLPVKERVKPENKGEAATEETPAKPKKAPKPKPVKKPEKPTEEPKKPAPEIPTQRSVVNEHRVNNPSLGEMVDTANHEIGYIHGVISSTVPSGPVKDETLEYLKHVSQFMAAIVRGGFN